MTSTEVMIGHIRSNPFFAITSYRRESQPCRWSRCLHLVETHLLMFYLNRFRHNLTFWSRDRSNFDLDRLGSLYTWFDASWRGKHDGVWALAPSLFIQKFFVKNTIPILFFEILTELLNGRLDVIRPITKHSLFALTPPPESAIPGFRQDLVRTFGVTSRLDTVPSAHLRQLASVRPLTDNARHYTLEQFFYLFK